MTQACQNLYIDSFHGDIQAGRVRKLHINVYYKYIFMSDIVAFPLIDKSMLVQAMPWYRKISSQSITSVNADQLD